VAAEFRVVQHTLATAKITLGLACALWVGSAPAQSADFVEAESGSEPGAAPPTSERTRIVLVVSPGMEELAVRFVAELSSLRLDVVRAPGGDVAPSAEELEELAGRHGARVALRVSRAGHAVDLWLVNPQTHEVVYRRIVADSDPAVAVLRSLEILRGALVEIQVIAPKPGVEALPAPPGAGRRRRPTRSARAAPPLWLGVSGTLIAARAGRGLGAGATGSLHGRVGSRFAIHAAVVGPLSEWSVDGQGGSAKVWLAAATIGALVTPWGERMLTPGLGLGVGLVGLHTRGEAVAGYRGTSDLNFAAFPHGRLELAIGLSGSIRLKAALATGFVAPRPTLLFAEERAEAWLNPLFLSSLGAEVALP